jgi:hypothetical protein
MTLLFMLLLAVGVVALPAILRWYIAYTGKSAAIYARLLYTLWVCAAPAFAALFCLGRLLRNIDGGQVFVEQNVSLLRLISWCCLAVAGVFLVAAFYYVISLLLGILAAFMGLILRVVKNVIARAVELQRENDLTV